MQFDLIMRSTDGRRVKLDLCDDIFAESNIMIETPAPWFIFTISNIQWDPVQTGTTTKSVLNIFTCLVHFLILLGLKVVSFL